MSERILDIEIRGTGNLNQYEELVKVFLQPAQYRIHGEETEGGAEADPSMVPAAVPGPENSPAAVVQEDPDVRRLVYDVSLDEAKNKAGDRYVVIRQMYEDLAAWTGKRPKWGVLTGIRPVKLAGEIEERLDAQSEERSEERSEEERASAAELLLQRQYLLHPHKARLATEILHRQRRLAGQPPEDSLSLYIGIPFCPTRCLYCSFTSNQVNGEEIRRYMTALEKEIRWAGEAVKKAGLRVESVYMGGGTPTTPEPELLEELLGTVDEAFDFAGCREYTVEAGRPDTITAEKLEILRNHGVDRISINPQSMQQRTLDLIGRKHTTEDVRRAFTLAKEAGFSSINADLIAGLPGEDYGDFTDSLEQMIGLGADNITLHTLAVKRASRLKERDENFHYRDEELREKMLAYAGERLRREGFLPYYLYRQKHTSGNTENIGFCREDRISIYNIRIMEEHQSILALGAGGISKVWFPEQNRLERVPNVSNYEIYIDRIDDMIDRKRKGFFGQEE